MATTDDVEMADADRPTVIPTSRSVLNAITSGNLHELRSPHSSVARQNILQVARDDAENDVESDLLAPFLPMITRIHLAPGTSHLPVSSAKSSFASVLRGYGQVNELSEYTVALQELTPDDLNMFAAQEPTDTTPLHRKFENSSFRDRACMVLDLVRAFTSQNATQTAVHEQELVRNDIYKPHLVAILVNALARDALASAGLTLENIVVFCLAIPLGAELIEAIVLNDPSTFTDVVELTVRSIQSMSPPLANSDPSSPGESPSTLLPFELRQALAICSALASLSPVYATQIVLKLRDVSMTSTSAVYIAFQLLVDVPSLRLDYASIVFQWMKRVAARTTPKTVATTPLYTFLQMSLAREGGGDSATTESSEKTSSFQEESRYVMSQFRQFLIEDIVQFTLSSDPTKKTHEKTSRLALIHRLSVLIGLLVVGQLHPEDHETTQLLRLFDTVAKDLQQAQPQRTDASRYERLISLMFVLVLLLCAPSASAFAKMPSQREDSTKIVLQLAQQSIYSLYNTKAACPLFVLSSVLLYTKSLSLLPFLNSVLEESVPLLAPNLVRVDQLYGVGDAVLKPILTENVMAREVLTTFHPIDQLSALDHNVMHEMALRSLHGLLTERSFLRHQHARKLEEWMCLQLDRATTPVHPLLVSVLLEWIENYVMAFEYPVAQRPLLQLAIIPLSPTFVSRALSQESLRGQFQSAHGAQWTKAVFVLIYALQFNQRLRQASAVPGTKLHAFANQGVNDQPSSEPPIRGSANTVLAYDVALFPLKKIANQVARFAGLGQAFEFAAPTLQRLIAEELPQLIASDCVAVPRVVPRLGRVCGVKHKLSLQLQLTPADGDALPRVSWLSACAWLRGATLATTAQVEEILTSAVESLLPLAILSMGPQSTNEIASPEAFLTTFVELFETRARVAHSNLARLDTKLAEALCVPQLVWRQFQSTQQRRLGSSSSVIHSGTASSTRNWISREQLIEEPFYVLRNAYQRALTSPSLLRLALSITKRCRDECVFVVRQREATVALGTKTAQANDGSVAPATPSISTTGLSPPATFDPATHQFLVVQDSIIIQSMLGLVLEASQSREQSTTEERVLVLYQAIDQVLAETSEATPPLLGSLPLALSIQTQGYDATLVPAFVAHVTSFKCVWTYWMQPPPPETKSASDRRSSARESPHHHHHHHASNYVSKALTEFVSDALAEKDLVKWQFRVRVFFALCGKYFVATTHTNAVVSIIKQIMNRLRTIAVNVAGGGGATTTSASAAAAASSSKSVVRAAPVNMSDTERVAFVEAMLGDMVTGCARHAELRSEVAQFLLSLKKHIGSSHSHQYQQHQQHQQSLSIATSPSGVEYLTSSVGYAPPRPAAGKPARSNINYALDRVVFHAYQRILESM